MRLLLDTRRTRLYLNVPETFPPTLLFVRIFQRSRFALKDSI
jgi:hypothetical protein